tara:strand:- start:6598 stop:7029 length:432 start_codon:yes stop_codon:yes gene_type:complete
MTILNLTLSSVLIISAGWALFAGYQNRKRLRLNEHIADELDVIIHNVIDSVHKTKKYVANAEDGEQLLDGHMISTLVTVLVKKIGSLRLTMSDFARVGDDEYVSVYVDTKTQEIILSMDNALAQNEENITMAPFINTDDSTFH